MQIKLIQTEIEEAITAHIQNQVTVKEGMQIDITLSATRGDEGFIAIVDITKGTSITATATVTEKPAAAQPAAVAAPAAVAKATPTIRKAAPPKEAALPGVTGPEAADVAADSGEIPPPFEADPEPAQAPSESQEAPAATSAPAPGRSLFSGLSAPTNK